MKKSCQNKDKRLSNTISANIFSRKLYLLIQINSQKADFKERSWMSNGQYIGHKLNVERIG